MTATINFNSLLPIDALRRLQEGNFRFVHNIRQRRDLLKQVEATAGQQNPFAVVLSCMDSRTSNELIFDLGIGDIFSIRIAGNIVNEDVLGSLEFACKMSGARFIVILGHTGCGAIKGACDALHMGNLTGLLQAIKPAVDAEQQTTAERHSGNEVFTGNVARIHAELGIREVISRSPILKAMLEQGEIGIIPALYHVETGVVEFFEDAMILHSGVNTDL